MILLFLCLDPFSWPGSSWWLVCLHLLLVASTGHCPILSFSYILYIFYILSIAYISHNVVHLVHLNFWFHLAAPGCEVSITMPISHIYLECNWDILSQLCLPFGPRIKGPSPQNFTEPNLTTNVVPNMRGSWHWLKVAIKVKEHPDEIKIWSILGDRPLLLCLPCCSWGPECAQVLITDIYTTGHSYYWHLYHSHLYHWHSYHWHNGHSYYWHCHCCGHFHHIL